ncbi:MAG: beta-hydroxyacyl-ACP dehydratase [Bacteriovoracaceae bacterium]|jgi:3-hydroxyacyl-[acyl-carrier-protein] dehydratase|nr:beta-hydroxyacyl-ACP dehydratase [Bacteriovoracaceae bacterium]
MNIKDLIPQREPFLFIDEIVEKGKDKILTSYLVKGTEDFFKGHFPGNPIMPGVLLQEALFQTGAALISGNSEGIGVVTKVSNAKFKSLVRPNDNLCMEVILDDQLLNAYYFKGKIRVNGKIVAAVDFNCALIQN